MTTGDLILDVMNFNPIAIVFALFTLVCIAGLVRSGIESERSVEGPRGPIKLDAKGWPLGTEKWKA